ncbi:hypothetical protein J8273_8932 [Carpediemonas membranifera]|uniref:Uncharacterized protein n=1 Tax=Carpediemonas membranifera TaxID=201153 RepID=A0A8J6DYP6_9EUKA|nr:hypothetical protein J8273_8932 [Carpediemonas membranifera]|eukprot:KAG9389633.1 hypothetical protein J8273_8932 [Carpediemonas membranifera]
MGTDLLAHRGYRVLQCIGVFLWAASTVLILPALSPVSLVAGTLFLIIHMAIIELSITVIPAYLAHCYVGASYDPEKGRLKLSPFVFKSFFLSSAVLTHTYASSAVCITAFFALIVLAIIVYIATPDVWFVSIVAPAIGGGRLLLPALAAVGALEVLALFIVFNRHHKLASVTPSHATNRRILGISKAVIRGMIVVNATRAAILVLNTTLVYLDLFLSELGGLNELVRSVLAVVYSMVVVVSGYVILWHISVGPAWRCHRASRGVMVVETRPMDKADKMKGLLNTV